MERHHWPEWLTGVIGLWLIVSPFVLPYAPSATDAAPMAGMSIFVVAGLIALAIAAIGYTERRNWEATMAIVLGLALIAAPWFFGFAEVGTSLWNAVLSGAALTIVAIAEFISPQYGSHA